MRRSEVSDHVWGGSEISRPRYFVGDGREYCSCQVAPPSAVARMASAGRLPAALGTVVPRTQPALALTNAAAVGLDSGGMAWVGPRVAPPFVPIAALTGLGLTGGVKRMKAAESGPRALIGPGYEPPSRPA